MSDRYKYPKTPHLPWSPSNKSSEDLLLADCTLFEGKEVVVTEKMDGENTSMYSNYIHARSLSSKPHPSRDWVKKLHAGIAPLIPEGWRLCGENLYASHSIFYENLKSYFYLFSIWNEKNICLSWNQTMEWAKLLDLETPTIIYEGMWSEEFLKKLSLDSNVCEGYVVRVADSFSYVDFEKNIVKWVRKEHIQTDQNWMHNKIIPNKLKPKSTG